MDNSESDTNFTEKPLLKSAKNDESVKNVGFQMTNGNGVSNGTENGKTNGENDVAKQPQTNGSQREVIGNGTLPGKILEMPDNDEEEKEIPFKSYENGDTLFNKRENYEVFDQRLTNGDGSVSPTKIGKMTSELRRISCKDVYPDRQTEDFEMSDDDSSDEDDPAQKNDSTKNSPKGRRKLRSDCHSLLWCDDELNASTMHHLDVFRRSKIFCDLVLQVAGREVHCHRVVVGGGSRFLYKELVQSGDENNPVGRISLNQIQPALSPDALEHLIDYMYTAKLIIPQGQLSSIYRASVKLRMERVMPVCRRHIINRLDTENCVETWRLASDVEDIDLLKILDEYIEENFEAVTKSNAFLALPRIKMQAVTSNPAHDAPPFHVLPRDSALSQLALSWIMGMVQRKGGRYMEELTEQIQRISLEELTNAVSYASSNSSSTSSPSSNKQPPSQNEDAVKTSPSRRLSRASSIDSLSSSNSEDGNKCNRCEPDGQWAIITSMQTSDHMIALCLLGDILSSVILHLPNNMISNANFGGSNSSHSNSASTSSSSSHSCASSVGSVSDLSHLSQARCAAGVTALNGKIFAIGGYNQSECLDTVECYDPVSNRWSALSKMHERRARFTAAVLHGQIYAVGGSTGSRDHVSVERYDPVSDKWFQAPPLPIRCSGVGVAVMNNLLYCIGGVQQSTGVAGIKSCHAFDFKSQKWRLIAQLNTGRSFAGVAELNKFLFCVGGTDGWTSLTSVERYDGEKWIRSAPLNIPRRGAGVAQHNGMLYCVGGSDGGSFWATVEQYSIESDIWTALPTSMTVPRSNVGLVSLNGLLFAVGGYSGRQFLNSMETLDESGEEWTTHDTHLVASSANSNTHAEGDQADSKKELTT